MNVNFVESNPIPVKAAMALMGLLEPVWRLPMVPPSQANLAKIETVHAPMGVKSEGAVPNAWVYVDVKGVDIGTYVQMAMRAVNDGVAGR